MKKLYDWEKEEDFEDNFLKDLITAVAIIVAIVIWAAILIMIVPK